MTIQQRAAKVLQEIDEQLNIAMCEWMGWRKSPFGWCAPETNELCTPPNYLSDDSPRRLLNEAEARLTPDQWNDRCLNLMRLTMPGVEYEDAWSERDYVSASARQRTIAILRIVKPEIFT